MPWDWMSTVVGGEPFFLDGNFFSFANIFWLKSRMTMKLIFLERARLRQHFEYPFYGHWTHRKIFRAIWISKKLWKMHFFSLTEGPTKSPHQLYQIQKNASSLFLWPWRIIQTLFDKAFVFNRSARAWGVCYIPTTCDNKAWKVLYIDLMICVQIQYILFLKVLQQVPDWP